MGAKTLLRSVAVLFTDLVGSSKMYAQRGDKEAVDIVETHFKILQSVLKEHGGTLIKTIGDALFGSFKDPADAVKCAIAMHEALRKKAGHPGFHLRPVRIRAGVHAGAGILMGNDIFGDTVNVAARVVGVAGADEVMCTREVMERLSPEMVGQFKFHAPIIPKGTLNVIEVFRWKAPGFQVLTKGKDTFTAGGSEMGPSDWRFDDRPRELYAMSIKDSSGKAIRKVIGPANCVVGREDGSDEPVDVPVRTRLVSRTHLCFNVVRGQLWVFDLDSKNGVFVRYPGEQAEEMKVQAQAPLTVGSRGRFGDCRFACEEAPAGAMPATTIEKPKRARNTDIVAGGRTRAVSTATERFMTCVKCLTVFRIASYDTAKTYTCPACKLILVSKRLVAAKASDIAVELKSV